MASRRERSPVLLFFWDYDTQWGADINDAGTIVGTTQVSQIVGTRGFVASGTSMVTLPILPAGDTEFHSGAVAINNAGQIAGYSPSGIDRHAVIWNAGVKAEMEEAIRIVRRGR